MIQEQPIKRQSVWIWEEDYPYSLNARELQDPIIALEDVFSNYSLVDCQYLLWEWKHCHYRPYLFSFGNGIHTLYHFMGKLQKLLNVAWLIDKEFSCAQLLVAGNDLAFREFKDHNYCSFFCGLKNSLKVVITESFRQEEGLQGFMNVLRHWWDMGADWRHLDVGDRCNVGGEISEFRGLTQMVEVMNFIYKSNGMKETQNLYACSSYLSLEEGRQPVKTIMRIFDKWEYEDLKEFLRKLFYTMEYHGGLEEGIMGDRGGIVHTFHKLIDLAQQLSLNDESFFGDLKHFIIDDFSEFENFWTDYDRPPFHHLPKMDLDYLVNKLKGIKYDLLHRNLHEFMLLLVGSEGTFTDNYTSVLSLFQGLEELLEVLYLIMLSRVQTEL
ncbi:hypothetical protein [Sphingobacterium sp. BIGb0165]|uniref:hypothetical protein n=1 Tax=Sphingobacterium sp. BIGb0165 TaxID=2940615 RepID=UPI0021691677|nr:hypothetical protein [Sphingobacterium sp. BIGb0165]MCS4227274.1 hypothetical protein [Sphingobacterium sp. BIGb0165]